MEHSIYDWKLGHLLELHTYCFVLQPRAPNEIHTYTGLIYQLLLTAEKGAIWVQGMVMVDRVINRWLYHETGSDAQQQYDRRATRAEARDVRVASRPPTTFYP
jgi:hypothetical protein